MTYGFVEVHFQDDTTTILVTREPLTAEEAFLHAESMFLHEVFDPDRTFWKGNTWHVYTCAEPADGLARILDDVRACVAALDDYEPVALPRRAYLESELERHVGAIKLAGPYPSALLALAAACVALMKEQE